MYIYACVSHGARARRALATTTGSGIKIFRTHDTRTPIGSFSFCTHTVAPQLDERLHSTPSKIERSDTPQADCVRLTINVGFVRHDVSARHIRSWARPNPDAHDHALKTIRLPAMTRSNLPSGSCICSRRLTSFIVMRTATGFPP